MSRWWRAYDEAVDDPKLCLLTDKQHRAWFNLCCITSQNDGKLPPIAAVAFKLRMTVDRAKSLVAELVALGLVDNTDGVFAPHNWDSRQYKTDVTDPTAASRSKRYRDKRRDAPRDVDRDAAVTDTVTVKRPETETETEQSRVDSARKRGARLPEDWSPNASDFADASLKLGALAHHELLKFKDYWKAQPGQRGVKLDWDATWRNWIRNAKGPANGNRNSNPRTSGHDAILAAAARAAGKIVGDGAMAGAGSATEFPFGDGDVHRGAGACGEPAERSGGDHDGREPAAGGVLEGEIIAPDKAAAGISGGRRPH